MKKYLPLLLLSAALLPGRPARAQSGEGSYSAPGFPMQLPRRHAPAPPPAAPALVSPILDRFWHDAVNGRQRASDFYKFMSTNLNYPPAAAHAGMEGRVFVRLTVAANGRVRDAQVVRHRTASRLLNPPSQVDLDTGTAALEAETLRIFRAARFEPARLPADTVTVSASFQIE